MQRKIKIAFISYLLDIGGLETLILELCRKLISSEKFLPIVCTFQNNGKLQKEFEEADIPIFITEKKFGTDWTLPLRLARIFKEQKVDIVHTHNSSTWLYGGVAAKLCRLPLLHTEHTPPDYHERRWIIIEQMLAMITQQITAVSKGVADFLIGEGKISAEKIKVLYNGVDIKKYAEGADVKFPHEESSIQEIDMVVGNISRLTPIKDHATLLYAFKEVVQRAPRAKLLIVGDGPLKNELLCLRDKLGIKDKVEFLGFQRDIPQLLKLFNIFAFSSIPSIKEGLSMSVLEAMASGLPVVSTGIKGTAEAVIDGETGFIVPPREPKIMADAIYRLLLNREEAKRMGESGLERVKRYFSFEKMMSEYESIYQSMVNGRKENFYKISD